MTLAGYLGFVCVLFLIGVSYCFGDSSNDGTADGTTKTYYWQGAQLDNLSRLAGSSPDFEQEQRRTQLGQTKDEYLATIREQMARQTKSNDQNKAVINLNGEISQEALQITYGATGIHATLHAQLLFDENSASLKTGAVDVVDRLRRLLQAKDQSTVELTISDVLDDAPGTKDVDAERSLLIFGLLEFPEKGAHQENLSPEELASP